MSPAHFEADLLERRRLRLWHRLARPDAPAPAECELDAPESGAFPHGYPRENLLPRLLLPVALAIFFFLFNDPAPSETSDPRGTTSETQQP